MYTLYAAQSFYGTVLWIFLSVTGKPQPRHLNKAFLLKDNASTESISVFQKRSEGVKKRPAILIEKEILYTGLGT